MFSIKDYYPQDAVTILSWIPDEKVFRQWSADKYKDYPAKPEDMNTFYEEMMHNGGRPFVFCDDDKVIGHFVLRPLTEEITPTVRIGFIIVDSSVRGKGYGRKMLEAAFDYAFVNYDCKRITLGVFENNPKAKKCYESVGFRQWGSTTCRINGEDWLCFEMEYLKD